jgi:endo-1,4-beta-xylanase
MNARRLGDFRSSITIVRNRVLGRSCLLFVRASLTYFLGQDSFAGALFSPAYRNILLRDSHRSSFKYFSLFASVFLFMPFEPVAAGGSTTLREAYGNLFDVGVAIPSARLSDAERAKVCTNFTGITPENSMKADTVHPEEGRYDFRDADEVVKLAQRNNLKVNGHTLVWHSQCPDWFFSDAEKPADRDLVLKRMREHIQGVMAHFRGKVSSWDVVNEAIADDEGYLRQSKWLDSIGEEYIAEAFTAAHTADPEAELYYNDYNIELPEKRAKALRLIRELKARNVPIDGIGIQGHWILDNVPFKEIEDTIVAFHREGLKVMITELDIDVVPRHSAADVSDHETAGANDLYANGCPPEVLQRQAQQYAELFAIFKKHADKIARVTFWGLDDGKSWLNDWPSKRTNYPLLWSRDLQPKPALDAILSEAQK